MFNPVGTQTHLFFQKNKKHTLQGINISHLGKRNIIFKMPFFGDMLVFLEGIPQNLHRFPQKVCRLKKQTLDVWNIYLNLTQILGLNDLNGCFLKWCYPQIIHFNKAFHYKPSILGYPYFWKYPNIPYMENLRKTVKVKTKNHLEIIPRMGYRRWSNVQIWKFQVGSTNPKERSVEKLIHWSLVVQKSCSLVDTVDGWNPTPVDR